MQSSMWWGVLAATAILALPLDATYATRIRVPLIGAQDVSLHLTNRTHARVALSGIVRREGYVAYARRVDGGYDFDLDDCLRSLMRTYRCDISDAAFDEVADEARLTLHIRPLRLRRRLRLARVPRGSAARLACGI